MIAYQTHINTARITRIAFLLAFIWVLVAVSATANAETWNTSRPHYFGQWSSLLMTLGSSDVARADTSIGGDMLTVNFTKGKCESPKIMVLAKAPKYFGKNYNSWFGAYFRVDSGPIYKGIVFASGETGENTYYLQVTFAQGTKQELISSMEHGQTLRIKLTKKDVNTVYLHFSLSGSSESISRAQQICKSLKPDSQYFH